jgi:hypothetical protein
MASHALWSLQRGGREITSETLCSQIFDNTFERIHTSIMREAPLKGQDLDALGPRSFLQHSNFRALYIQFNSIHGTMFFQDILHGNARYLDFRSALHWQNSVPPSVLGVLGDIHVSGWPCTCALRHDCAPKQLNLSVF